MDWLLLLIIVLNLGVLLYMGYFLRCWLRHLDAKIERVAQQSKKRLIRRFDDKMEEKALELQNTISLTAMNFHYPVSFGGWSVDSFLAKYLLQFMVENKPGVIVEIGSGASTVLLARCSELLDYNPTHIAVDHELRYLELTRKTAKLNNLDKRVQFWEHPLGESQLDGHLWYSGLVAAIGDLRIDLLLVDGPPGSIQTNARYPALPLLRDKLNKGATVILDDACRTDEKYIVEEWCKVFPEFSVEYIHGGHEAAVIRERASC